MEAEQSTIGEHQQKNKPHRRGHKKPKVDKDGKTIHQQNKQSSSKETDPALAITKPKKTRVAYIKIPNNQLQDIESARVTSSSSETVPINSSSQNQTTKNPPKTNVARDFKKKKNRRATTTPPSNNITTAATVKVQNVVVKKSRKQQQIENNVEKEEKLKQKINLIIEESLASLREVEDEIEKNKKHLLGTYDYESYLEKAQIFINDLDMIKQQARTFSHRMRGILQNDENGMLQKLKLAMIECKRITTNRLPIYASRNDILGLIDKHDVIICIAGTGNGKSTQIPQYLLEHGFNSIVCTQPRRLTCMTLANRVSEELNDNSIVSCLSVGAGRKKKSKLNFITDRGLLNEYQNDQLLLNYSVILVDEAHERSLYTDILLALLKDCVKRRRNMNNPLKLVIASATIDENLFSKFFDNCPVKKLAHQAYPVTEYFSHSREANVCEQATRKVTEIVKRNLHQGDILVFLSSKEEIAQCCKLAKKSIGQFCQIIPLHGKIENNEMKKIFNQSGVRKVIFSTNVAETSITIPGVRVVLDCGLMRQKFYDNDRNMSILKTIPISQTCAIQRKGRVGRLSSGVCYRLYPQSEYQRMKVNSEPEILRSHLGVSILQILSCGIIDICKFELIDMPSMESIIKEVSSLERLGFVSNGLITEIGAMACQLQMEPTLSRMIIQANMKGVHDLMAIIVAMMSISDILFKRSQTNILTQTLFSNDVDGDLISLLHIFQTYFNQSNKEEWCLNNKINNQCLKSAEITLKDIKSRMRFFKKIVISNGMQKEDLLKETIIGVQYQNLAYFDGYLPTFSKVYYIPSLKQRAFIHSSSHLYIGDPKPFILFSELVRTDKLYMKNITPIKIEEIQKFYPHLEANTIISKVKEECKVKLPSIISEDLKFRNTEFIEEIESQLGHVIEIDSLDSSMKVYCDKSERLAVISKIQTVVEIAKKRALSQVLEYDVGNGLRLMVSSGFKVVGLIFPNEFTKIQVDNLPLGVDDAYLKSLFLPHQAIDVRVYSSLPNDSFSSGYVIFKDFSEANTVYHRFKEVYKLTTVLLNTKSSNESALVRLKWSIGANNGNCFIVFKNRGNNLLSINAISNDIRFRSLMGSNVRFYSRIIKNKEALEVKDIYPHIDTRFIKNLLNERNIEFKNIIVPRIGEDIDEDLIQSCILSKVQPFKSFEFLDMLKIVVTDPFGEALACFSDRREADIVVNALNGTKFMKGLMWANSTHRETIKVPREVTQILLPEFERLISNSKSKIKSRSSRNQNSSEAKSEILIQSVSLEDFNEAKMQVVTLLKPTMLFLNIQSIQYAKTNQKKLRSIERNNNVHISVNSTTRTIEIYGRVNGKQTAKIEVMQLVNHQSKILTISLKYLKCITGDGGKPLQELKEKYPNCDISLNVKTKQLDIEGKESDQHAIQQYVTELLTVYEQTHNFAHDDDDCPVCFERMVNPFRMIGCNHEVCKDCFSFQIQTPNSFVCPCCDTDLSISEILLHLETKQEDSYIKSLENFLLENSQTYKYCPRSCGSICRIESDIMCQTCKKSFCKHCEKESHNGLRCDESDKSREWILANTKPCPRCNQRIEKSSGCNHMTCQYCGEHFCWLCLKGFDTAENTYNHFKNSNCTTFEIPPEPANANRIPLIRQVPPQHPRLPLINPLPNNNPPPQQQRPPIAIPQPNNQQNNPPEQRQGLFNCLVM